MVRIRLPFPSNDNNVYIMKCTFGSFQHAQCVMMSHVKFGIPRKNTYSMLELSTSLFNSHHLNPASLEMYHIDAVTGIYVPS
jgi:hypothetical protein